MQVAGNSVSSSVLKVLDLCVQAVPGAASVGAEKVWQTTLDRLVLPELQGARHSLIKVDTQGYEKLVLDGGEACLAAAVLVLLELSLHPLYADQALWLEMIAFMHARGFDVWSVQPEFMDASTAQLMQVNGIFYRSGPH